MHLGSQSIDEVFQINLGNVEGKESYIYSHKHNCKVNLCSSIVKSIA